MRIQRIIAGEDRVRFLTDGNRPEGARLRVSAFAPVCPAAETPLRVLDPLAEGDVLSVPRDACGRDGLCLRYVVTVDGAPAEGKRYVEEIDRSLRAYPYPETDSKKGLQISDAAAAAALGVRHSAINVNEGDLLVLSPEEGDAIEFLLDGRAYAFRRSRVEELDQRLRALTDAGVLVTLILLNSPAWSARVPDDLWAVIRHPRYDGEGLISAFNVETEEGADLFRAFVAFLADRYTREDARYGRAVGLIIGNEVDAPWIWGNAGEMPMEDYLREYAVALRLAYQTVVPLYRHMRIYLSLDHFWTEPMDRSRPLRYYAPRDMLLFLNGLCAEEGQIPWHVAYHPYPEDLNFPDFWNDPNATPDDDCAVITFRNLEVLPRFLRRPEFLYRGEPRRIILSEQGFNSHWTEESEVLQAAAYGRAYRKVMETPGIDSFILHAYRDNREEFGLNLGLMRRRRDSNELDAPKPICAVFRAIDRKDEKGVFHWERY